MGSTSRRFHSLRNFVQDGLWASVAEGIAESNFSPFAVAAQASAPEIGVFSGAQLLLSSWLQLWSERLITALGSRKRLVLLCVCAQAALLSMLVATAYFKWSLWLFMALAIGYGGAGSLSSPAWSSWIGDLLPSRRRGTCFAIRNRRTYPASFVALFAGGAALDRFGGHFDLRLAFCAVFALGFVAKLLSLSNLWRQQEFPIEPTLQRVGGPLDLVAEAARDGEIRRIVFFFGAMAFAVNLSAPFQVHYLLKTRGCSYLQYTVLLGIMSIARFLAAPAVGRIVDHLGSRRLLVYTAAVMPLLPLGWCLSRGYLALALLHFVSGLVWASYDLCAFTYLAESLPSAKLPRAFAARQSSANLLAFLGTLTGGALLQTGASWGLPSLGTGIVFWASTFGRVLAGLCVFALPLGLLVTEAENEAVSPEPAVIAEAA